MSRPPSPSATNRPRDVNDASTAPHSADETSHCLTQTSESILGKKRMLAGPLAHQFENGKSLRKGRSQSNAPALELTPMYDVLIRTRRKRVLQGMAPPPPVGPCLTNNQPPAGTRPTSAPISQHLGPVIRSSTVVPSQSTLSPPIPAPPENMSTAGPSNQPTQEEIIYVVKMVYASFHGLQTFMSDEDAWSLWSKLKDNERVQLFTDYHQTCKGPSPGDVPQELGGQAASPPHVKPLDSQPSSHLEPASGLPTSASGAPITPYEPTQKEILHAVKVVHAHHHKTNIHLNDEEAWALWIKWSIEERRQLFVSYQEVRAGSQVVPIETKALNEDQQPHPSTNFVQGQAPQEGEQHHAHDPNALHVPMAVETGPSSPVRRAGASVGPEHFPLPPEVRHPQPSFEHGEMHLPPRPPTAVRAHPPPSLHPFPGNQPLGTGHQAIPPPQQVVGSSFAQFEQQQIQWQSEQHRARDPSYNASHVPMAVETGPSSPVHRAGASVGPEHFPLPPEVRHPQPSFEHGEMYLPPRPPTAVRAHPPPSLHPFPGNQPLGTGHQAIPPPQQVVGSHAIQFGQQPLQVPIRQPTLVPIPPQVDDRGHHGLGYSARPPFQQQVWNVPMHQAHGMFPHQSLYSPQLPPIRPLVHEGGLPFQPSGTLQHGQPQQPHAYPPVVSHGQTWARSAQAGGLVMPQHPAQNAPQSQLYSQPPSEGRPEDSLVVATAPTHAMHHPIPSRPGPAPSYLMGPTTPSQTTQSDDVERMTEETMTQGTAGIPEFEMWEDSQEVSFVGTKDAGPSRLDKGKGRAADAPVNNFQRGRSGDFPRLEWDYRRPTPTPMDDNDLRLNRRPQRNDVPQFVNSDGTLLVVNRLQGLTEAVQESTRAQKEFVKEFRLFQETAFPEETGGHEPIITIGASLGVSQMHKVQGRRTTQQRGLDDMSPRALQREKRVNEKVQRLRGKRKQDSDEADDETDRAANNQARIRHSVTSFLGIHDWSTVADQYPALTPQQLQDYKQRKDTIVPTVLKNFRPDFSLPWKRHPFNKENREVFIDKYLARVEGGAYFKNPTLKEMLTREWIGFILDGHMKYCRDRWRKSLHPLTPERVAQLAKEAAQRSRRKTLLDSREVLVVRRGYTKHRRLFQILDPCNMSGDETDGEEKTADSNYRIIVSRWQSEELRNFFRTIDAYYREDWAHPPHRRAMGGNRPRKRVLRKGYSEDGIVPVGLWRNCYDKDWLAEQPSYVVRELEIVEEDYDFSFAPTAPSTAPSTSTA